MARMNHWQLAVALGFALFLLAGCEQKGPAQKAGENVDKAVDQAGKAMQKAGDKMQSPFAERLIGSIRRECLNHDLVLSERHLRRILIRYFAYYHRARTHLAFDKDAPDVRPVELPAAGPIVEIPEVGGLHRRYVRQAASSRLLGRLRP